MTTVEPDRIDRVVKLLVDAGDAPSFDAAAEMLCTYRFQIVADATACADPAWQAALLTAVNAGVRAMLGGVRVKLSADPRASVPVALGRPLSDALTEVGAEIVTELEEGVPTIAFGAAVRKATLHVFAGRWVAGVSPEPVSAPPAGPEVTAAVLAACIAVSEVFQRLRGHTAACERELAVSLWDPDTGDDGPPVTTLPHGLWLLGLGHLGQAYAWLLSLLPYPVSAARELVLQDDDRLSVANRATSMLHREQRVGMRKPRLVAQTMDGLGWDTRLLERRYSGGPLYEVGDPTVLLGGVDNPLARRRFDGTAMPVIYDAGLGAGPDGFLGITVRRLPGSRPAADLWPSEARASRAPDAGARAYADLAEQTGDQCGVEQLAGRTVATAFVGTAAACWVIGGLLRELHGGRAYELIDMSLREPADVVAIPAQGTRLRVRTVRRSR